MPKTFWVMARSGYATAGERDKMPSGGDHALQSVLKIDLAKCFVVLNVRLQYI